MKTSEKVRTVKHVALTIFKPLPPILSIIATGEVSSTGYSNARLAPYVYVTPPEDGMYEFDFVAEAPSGASGSAMTEIKSEEFKWQDFPKELKGVRIYAEHNQIEEMLSTATEKA